MTTIVLFPKPIPSTGPKPDSRQLRRNQIMMQRGLAVSPEHAAAADALATELVGTLRPWTDDDHADQVAMVVRIAIRSAQRRGVSLQSMLSIPRGRLLKLCDEGDPTCLVVLDWLLGNRKYIPDGFEETFSAATTDDREDA